MNNFTTGALTLQVAIENFALKEPFHISVTPAWWIRMSFTVTLEQGGHIGRGEASGVYYRKNDDATGIVKQIEAVRRTNRSGYRP